jgi:hypothetical protein
MRIYHGDRRSPSSPSSRDIAVIGRKSSQERPISSSQSLLGPACSLIDQKSPMTAMSAISDPRVSVEGLHFLAIKPNHKESSRPV